MRFLVYFLSPVPLALLGLLASMLVRGIPASAEGLPAFVVFGLIGGYVSMGLPSALFALGMLGLERWGAWRGMRFIFASAAGGLLGTTLALVAPVLSLPVVLLAPLGASVGLATTMLVDLVVLAPNDKPRRHIGAWVLAILMIPSFGGAGGTWLVDAARQRVLAGVSMGMSYDDVERVAGPPTHDSRERQFFLPTESVDVVWMYDRHDPGAAAVLVVSISFKRERVVEIRRTPVWRD